MMKYTEILHYHRIDYKASIGTEKIPIFLEH